MKPSGERAREGVGVGVEVGAQDVEPAERGRLEHVQLGSGGQQRVAGLGLAVVERDQHRRQPVLVLRAGQRRIVRDELADPSRVAGPDGVEQLGQVGMLRAVTVSAPARTLARSRPS